MKCSIFSFSLLIIVLSIKSFCSSLAKLTDSLCVSLSPLPHSPLLLLCLYVCLSFSVWVYSSGVENTPLNTRITNNWDKWQLGSYMDKVCFTKSILYSPFSWERALYGYHKSLRVLLRKSVLMETICSLVCAAQVGSVLSELHVLLEAEGEVLFWSTQKSSLVGLRVQDSVLPSLSSLQHVKAPTGFCQDWLSFSDVPSTVFQRLLVQNRPPSVWLESQGSFLSETQGFPGLACHGCLHSDAILTFS